MNKEVMLTGMENSPIQFFANGSCDFIIVSQGNDTITISKGDIKSVIEAFEYMMR